MSLLEVIRERRSVRKFEARTVPDEVLAAMIEGLRWAPSAGNLQSRHFYFVFEAGLRERLAAAALDQRCIAQAPLAVVACADHGIRGEYGSRGVDLYCLMDVAASVQNLLLVAEAEGLGTCWIAAFEEEKVRDLLEIPAHLRPVTIVPLGYPAEHPDPPPRVDPAEAVELIR